MSVTRYTSFESHRTNLPLLLQASATLLAKTRPAASAKSTMHALSRAEPQRKQLPLKHMPKRVCDAIQAEIYRLDVIGRVLPCADGAVTRKISVSCELVL